MKFKNYIIRKIGYIYYKIFKENLLKIYGNLRNSIFIIRRKSGRKNYLIDISQYLFTYDTKLQLSPVPKEIKDILDINGIKYRTGAHSIYIYRTDDIKKINEQIVYDYPKDIGLKIIFSQNISKDGSVFYTSNKVGPSSNIISVKAVGSVLDKIAISNILSLYNISPRVYDIIWIKSKKYKFQAMVVKNIEGRYVDEREGKSFIKKLKNILKKEDIKILGLGLKSIDFRPPNFNYNIIKAKNGNFYYVDIQNFEFKSKIKNILKLFPDFKKKKYFKNNHLLIKDKNNFKLIPSSNVIGMKTNNQIKVIFNIFEKEKYSVYNKKILDVGCNNGMLLFSFLNKGARWCVGLDKPKNIELINKFSFYNKFSRINLIGCDIFGSKINKLLPKKHFNVILYSGISHNQGFPEWLKKIDFDYFIYEGYTNEKIKNSIDLIVNIFPQYTVIHKGKYLYNKSKYYPLIVIKKTYNRNP